MSMQHIVWARSNDSRFYTSPKTQNFLSYASTLCRAMVDERCPWSGDRVSSSWKACPFLCSAARGRTP
jgi:hypothetical protein